MPPMTRRTRQARLSRGPQFQCPRCHTSTSAGASVALAGLRPEIVAALALPDTDPMPTQVCRSCTAHARALVFREQLTRERGALGELEKDIASRAAEHVAVAYDLEHARARDASLAERVADSIARVGGSWTFVITFCVGMATWMTINAVFLQSAAFDPYPFILLNLVLSCVAALQAPIILMSQNRSGERDRAQATQDYRVNLKAELEIAALHEKLDLLLHDKWETLADLQEAQMDLLEELVGRVEPKASDL